ncbi:MAG: tRNA (adenosine(37)-N6)-threonylcarbamoyltransferase complex ATPase subunit type 1 TsaE [Proteobacteria bacterium]|nr:tRNA (adenosine(37)-N6)-threonylcarbamoyltransferase complex ATPase subunit type 1 TsaE [Pseudomonadota bacterium]MBU4469848.1 tRNA (adenosine(37)-N6)-threonylcarbamoyltransferase complex ATPase subunit type 1 TsaE [Pseudomonadota bacterium]MCG2753083.1 tRNA (adenosine(37)-N6)-threonylcarbamoyltransferase complex ATPase subunit type 1 TsaE [Desulfobacteraceae bacterium]
MDKNPIQITSRSVEDTFAMGETVGRAVSEPVLILLTGDLGSGKTAFVQGLGKGLEVFENYYITSPSYTLINEYPARIPLFHVDLYRLNGPDDFESAGIYHILEDESHVVAMEWADLMDEALLPDPMTVNFTIGNHESRMIEISFGGSRWDTMRHKIIKEMQLKKWL